MLSIELDSAGYLGTPILMDQRLDLVEGEVLAVVGRSGSGKTSFLHHIAGMAGPDASGEARLYADGQRIHCPSPEVSILQQDYGLLPWRNTVRNVALPLELEGMKSRQRTDAAMAMLEQVGLQHKSDSMPWELSGGERQRAALARTLLREPALLLLDEPFSALDALTRESLQDLLLELLSNMPQTSCVFVTHSMEEATWMAHRIAVISSSPARVEIVEDGNGADPRTTHRSRESTEYLKRVARVRHAFTERAG